MWKMLHEWERPLQHKVDRKKTVGLFEHLDKERRADVNTCQTRPNPNPSSKEVSQSYGWFLDGQVSSVDR